MKCSKQIHVFHVVNSFEVGGMEQVVVNLINRLDSNVYRHSLCCIDKSGPMINRINVPLDVYEFGKGGKADYFIPVKLAKLIKRINPDIVHTRSWSAIDGVIGAAIAGVKAVIHDEHGRLASDPHGTNFKRNLIRRILGHLIINCIVPVSADLETWLLKKVKVPSHKVCKITNAVDTDLFYPANDKKAAKIANGMDADSFVIGFVGRLDPVKDIATLVKAFAILSSSIEHKMCLYIVGNGKEKRSLQELCIELGVSGNVVFVGESQEIPSIMKCFDCFSLTSIAEGIPMTLLEAMAAGIPIVATDVGGVGELVVHGETGFLIPVKSVDGLVSAFKAYLDCPGVTASHGRNGRKRAEENFSLSTMVNKYDSLYKSLANK